MSASGQAIENWTALEHYEYAGECGKRGQQCANASSVAIQLRDLVTQAQALAELERHKEQIRRRLASESLHIGACQEARNLYSLAQQTAGAFRSRLEAWWQKESARACERLRQQAQTIPAASGLFAQIEPWICILILSDALDAVTRAQIAHLHSVVDNLERKVDSEVRDFEAKSHPDYQTLDPKDVLKRQIEFCEQLKSELQEPQIALQICKPYIENGAALEARLHESVNKLNEWLKRLKDFERDRGTTVAQADFALLNGDFQSVDNALALPSGGQQVATTPGTPQPGAGFHGFTLHPTFIWLKDYVTKQKRRYENQLAHKQYLDWGLPLEKVQSVSELNEIAERWQRENPTAPPALRSAYNDFIADLRRAFDVGRYPLERVFDRLEQMHKDEPEDVCKLQAELKYTDPETLRQYEGYADIHTILQAKVTQIQNLREWLDQFKAVGPQITVRRACPGIVSWETEKPLIEKQRDHCELKVALEHCRQVRQGEDTQNPLFKGLWPLERAKAALEDVPQELKNPQSAIARAMDQERQNRLQKLIEQISECQKLEQDIEWRIREQPKRKDMLLEQLAYLREARASQWNTWLPWGKSKIQAAQSAFEDACKAYAQVCPCDPWFLKILDEEHVAIALPRCE